MTVDHVEVEYAPDERVIKMVSCDFCGIASRHAYRWFDATELWAALGEPAAAGKE